jgi:hypothetical protein
VTLQREECEKPWCLTDNALPGDTPQLAAGRLHFHLIERRTPYEISEQLAFRGGHMRGEPGQEPAAVLSLQVDEQTLGYVEW